MVNNISSGPENIYGDYVQHSENVQPLGGQTASSSYPEQFNAIVKDPSLTKEQKYDQIMKLKEKLDAGVENLSPNQQPYERMLIAQAYAGARMEMLQYEDLPHSPVIFSSEFDAILNNSNLTPAQKRGEIEKLVENLYARYPSQGPIPPMEWDFIESEKRRALNIINRSS